MNRLAWLVGSGALVMAGIAGTIGGCGSGDATVDDNGIDGSAEASGSSGSSGNGSSGSSGSGSNDGGSSGNTDGSANDGAANDGGGDGGIVSTPNKVQCGAAQCTTPTDFCCRTLNDAGCQATGTNCNNGAQIACEEKADCPGTQICCGQAGGGGASAQCKNDCGGGFTSFQLCKTNAECKTDAGLCYANTCPFGPGGATTVIDACRKIQGCTQ